MHVLLTGGSGFLGGYLRRTRPSGVRLSLIQRSKVEDAAAHVIQGDLVTAESLKAIRKAKPEAVLHTAAMASPALVNRHPTLAHAINVEAAVQLAEIAAELDIPFIFTSTDLVFDGRQGHYVETDSPNPLGLYARQKLEAEVSIRSAYTKALICRLPLMLGLPPDNDNFLHQLRQAFSEGKSFPLFRDEFRTPASGLHVARGLWEMLHRGVHSTVLHLGGPERLSRLDMGLRFCQFAGYDSQLATPVLQAELPNADQRPADVSLNSSKAFALGYNPGPFQEELEVM